MRKRSWLAAGSKPSQHFTCSVIETPTHHAVADFVTGLTSHTKSSRVSDCLFGDRLHAATRSASESSQLRCRRWLRVRRVKRRSSLIGHPRLNRLTVMSKRDPLDFSKILTSFVVTSRCFPQYKIITPVVSNPSAQLCRAL